MKKYFFLFFIIVGALFSSAPAVSAAEIYLGVASGDVRVGSMVTAVVYVSSSDKLINNAEGIITFPPDLLSVESISLGGSIFSIWIEQPAFSNSAGTISFNGGVPNPGFIGNSGAIIRVTFKAKKVGIANLAFAGASVYANDGFGTDVTSARKGLSITVISPQPTEAVPVTPVPTPATTQSPSSLVIHSTTHPDQTKSYSNNSPEFTWVLPKGALEVWTLISKSALGVPTVSYIPAISNKKVDELTNGTYYFSLRVRTSGGWSDISRYRVNIDTKLQVTSPVEVPPEPTGETGNVNIDTKSPVTTVTEVPPESVGEIKESYSIIFSTGFIQAMKASMINLALLLLFILLIIIIWYIFSHARRLNKFIQLKLQNRTEKLNDNSYDLSRQKIDADFTEGKYLDALSGYQGLQELTKEEKKSELNEKISLAAKFFVAEENFKKAQVAANLGNWHQAKILLDESEHVMDFGFKQHEEAKKLYLEAQSHVTEAEEKNKAQTDDFKKKLDETEQLVQKTKDQLTEQQNLFEEEKAKREKVEEESRDRASSFGERESALEKELASTKAQVEEDNKNSTMLVEAKQKEIQENDILFTKQLAEKQAQIANTEKKLTDTEKLVEETKSQLTYQQGLLVAEQAKREKAEDASKNSISSSQERESVLKKELESTKVQVIDYEKEFTYTLRLMENTKEDARAQIATIGNKLTDTEKAKEERESALEKELASTKAQVEEGNKNSTMLVEAKQKEIQEKEILFAKQLAEKQKLAEETKSQLTYQKGLLVAEQAKREKLEKVLEESKARAASLEERKSLLEKELASTKAQVEEDNKNSIMLVEAKQKKQFADTKNLADEMKVKLNNQQRLLATEKARREKAEEGKRKESVRFKEKEIVLNKAIEMERRKSKNLLSVIAKLS